MSETEKLAKRAVLIAGPTASGKSALALKIARERGGTIVNTDSMQVYSVLSLLTARPSAEDLEQAPHHLYGHVSPSERYSTGAWLADVEKLISSTETSGGPLIFVGGTGLYFRALLGGLSDMPEIPDSVRQRWRYRLAEEGASKLHRVLRAADPEAAMVLKPADGQRIVRALEVMEVSNRSILQWQGTRGNPLVDPGSAERIVLEVDRDRLAATISSRFDHMIGNGALDEVRQLLDLGLDDSLPAMKAIGVREMKEVLEGRMDMGTAVNLAKTATRQYAKRQATWFRHQCGSEWRRMHVELPA